MIDDSYIDRYYPISYTSRVIVDGTAVLTRMMRERLPQSGLVLDIGAGHGNGTRHPCKRPGIRLIGVDVSADVIKNQQVDQYFVQDANSLPFANNEIDAVFSDFTIEHLETPSRVIAEVSRVLKPGGPFVFRTVNAFHYVAIGAVLLRGRLRNSLLRRTGRSPEDLFKTHYQLNTKRAITRLLNEHCLSIEEMLFIEGPPVYLSFSKPLCALGVAYERLANLSPKTDFLRANILVAARKSKEVADA